jgi:hypothetical protein
MQSSGTATAGLPDGTVTSTARSNSLTLNSQLTVQNLQTFTQVNPANSYTYYTSEDGVNGNRTVTTTSSSGASAGLRSSTLAGAAPGTDLNVRSNDSFPKLDLKVTAHTLLVLEGSSKLDISADRSNLQQYIQETGPDVFDPNHIRSSYITAFGEARASVNVALTDDASILYSGLSNSGDLSVAALGAILRYDSDGFRLSQWDDPNTAVTSSSSQSKDWLVQLTNLGDTDKTAYLQTELNTSLSQNISSHTYDTVYTFVPGDPPQVPDVPNVPGIPEPGTCALMGLGLAGVALARRRARITA